MAEQKHTSGPWHVTEAKIPSGEIMVLGGEGFDFGCIASVTEMQDAHLIAAAPDLIETERKLANEVGGLTAFENDIRAIIGNTNWSVLMQRMDEAVAAIAKAEGQP